MSLANLRDIALMYFILIAFSVTLLPGVLLFLAIKGLRIGRRKLIPYIHLTQFYVRRVERTTDRVSRAVAKPFVVAAGVSAQTRYYSQRVVNLFKRSEAPKRDGI